jgi:hypothetical protein
MMYVIENIGGKTSKKLGSRLKLDFTTHSRLFYEPPPGPPTFLSITYDFTEPSLFLFSRRSFTVILNQFAAIVKDATASRASSPSKARNGVTGNLGASMFNSRKID